MSDKLCNPKSNNNIFWSVYKKLFNDKKQFNIPPLCENNIFVSNFLEKTTIFNNYFADIRRPIDNGSFIPEPTLIYIVYQISFALKMPSRKLYI